MMQLHLEERTRLLEQLSDWLLHTNAKVAWRNVFLGGDSGQVEFGHKNATVLCAERPADWTPENAEALLLGSGAHFQPLTDGELLMVFDSPAAALRAALEILRSTRATSLRMAMATGRFTYADVRYDNRLQRLYYGEDLTRARRMILTCVPGTLHLCPDAYRAVQRLVAQEVPEALVATEFLRGEVVNASITLPPSDNAYLSSFAGLGLV